MAEHSYITNPRGHIWQLNEWGEVDIFGYESGFHNGPRCTKCDYTFCHHCEEGPDEDCPVKDNEQAAASSTPA